MPRSRVKVSKWTVCPTCESGMFNPDEQSCESCDAQSAQERAIAEADEWIDGLSDACSNAVDRNRLVMSIQRAFEDAEQELIDWARSTGRMEPM